MGSSRKNQNRGRCAMDNPRGILRAAIALGAIVFAAGPSAQERKHYRFAYDQTETTGYGILRGIFSHKIKGIEQGTMLVQQYSGSALRQGPPMLQLVKSSG